MTETWIQPLTREHVREILEGLDLKVLTDPDGDPMVILADERVKALAFAAFAVSPGQVLSYMAQVQGAPNWTEEEALRRVNAWNAERRWPRAFLRGGKIHLDYHWALEEGVHPALLRDLLFNTLAGTVQFLLWLDGLEA